MAPLYPSWIEIPVTDLDRARTFYRTVFALTDTPTYDNTPPLRSVVLRPSVKEQGVPGVSLVWSPEHTPSRGGVEINFHVGAHARLTTALEQVERSGGTVRGAVVEESDGVRYVRLWDSEGNPIALSSYESVEASA